MSQPKAAIHNHGRSKGLHPVDQPCTDQLGSAFDPGLLRDQGSKPEARKNKKALQTRREGGYGGWSRK